MGLASAGPFALGNTKPRATVVPVMTSDCPDTPGPRQEAQELLERFAAAADLRASCERFGLLGQEVAEFADAASARTRAEAENFLETQFDRILALISPKQRGEDRSWRQNSARELARSAAGEDLEAALRDLSRLRVAAERLV